MKIPISEKRRIVDTMLAQSNGVSRLIWHARIAYEEDHKAGLKSIKQCIGHHPDVLDDVLTALGVLGPPKAGTMEYYKEALSIIWAIAVDYDGYDPKNANQMRGLVDDMQEVATLALKGKKLYV